MARERDLLTIVAHASAVSCAQRASERESEPRVRTHAAVVARAHSIKRRSRGSLELTHDTLAALHTVRTHDRFRIRVFSALDGPSRLYFHFLDGPDCGKGEIAESVMGIEHTATSRTWTVQIVGWRGGGDCRILDGSRTRSKMWFHGISTVQIVGGRFAESLASHRLGAYSTYICVVNFCLALLF